MPSASAKARHVGCRINGCQPQLVAGATKAKKAGGRELASMSCPRGGSHGARAASSPRHRISPDADLSTAPPPHQCWVIGPDLIEQIWFGLIFSCATPTIHADDPTLRHTAGLVFGVFGCLWSS